MVHANLGVESLLKTTRKYLKNSSTRQKNCLLNVTINIPHKCVKVFTAMKAHLADKNLCWKSSWAARICCVILSVNEYKWEFDLYNRLGLPPLSLESKNELNPLITERHQLKNKRNTEEYRQKTKTSRHLKRQKNKKDGENSTYKNLRTTKSKFTRKRKSGKLIMPQKMRKAPEWFRQFGFTGAETDDENDYEYKGTDAINNDAEEDDDGYAEEDGYEKEEEEEDADSDDNNDDDPGDDYEEENEKKFYIVDYAGLVD